MVHEQKFKDLLSNTCQVSVERIVLDLESEGPGSIPTGGNILSLDFFHVVNASDATIDIMANVVNLQKTRLRYHFRQHSSKYNQVNTSNERLVCGMF